MTDHPTASLAPSASVSASASVSGRDTLEEKRAALANALQAVEPIKAFSSGGIARLPAYALDTLTVDEEVTVSLPLDAEDIQVLHTLSETVAVFPNETEEGEMLGVERGIYEIPATRLALHGMQDSGTAEKQQAGNRHEVSSQWTSNSACDTSDAQMNARGCVEDSCNDNDSGGAVFKSVARKALQAMGVRLELLEYDTADRKHSLQLQFNKLMMFQSGLSGSKGLQSKHEDAATQKVHLSRVINENTGTTKHIASIIIQLPTSSSAGPQCGSSSNRINTAACECNGKRSAEGNYAIVVQPPNSASEKSNADNRCEPAKYTYNDDNFHLNITSQAKACNAAALDTSEALPSSIYHYASCYCDCEIDLEMGSACASTVWLFYDIIVGYSNRTRVPGNPMPHSSGTPNDGTDPFTTPTCSKSPLPFCQDDDSCSIKSSYCDARNNGNLVLGNIYGSLDLRDIRDVSASVEIVESMLDWEFNNAGCQSSNQGSSPETRNTSSSAGSNSDDCVSLHDKKCKHSKHALSLSYSKTPFEGRGNSIHIMPFTTVK